MIPFLLALETQRKCLWKYTESVFPIRQRKTRPSYPNIREWLKYRCRFSKELFLQAKPDLGRLEVNQLHPDESPHCPTSQVRLLENKATADTSNLSRPPSPDGLRGRSETFLPHWGMDCLGLPGRFSQPQSQLTQPSTWSIFQELKTTPTFQASCDARHF